MEEKYVSRIVLEPCTHYPIPPPLRVQNISSFYTLGDGSTEMLSSILKSPNKQVIELEF